MFLIVLEERQVEAETSRLLWASFGAVISLIGLFQSKWFWSMAVLICLLSRNSVEGLCRRSNIIHEAWRTCASITVKDLWNKCLLLWSRLFLLMMHFMWLSALTVEDIMNGRGCDQAHASYIGL